MKNDQKFYQTKYYTSSDTHTQKIIAHWKIFRNRNFPLKSLKQNVPEQ